MWGIISTAFLLGFVGDLLPGPVTASLIKQSVKRGFITGPLFTVGRLIADIVFLALAFSILSFVVNSFKTILYVFGIGFLLFIAYMTLRSKGSFNIDSGKSKFGPVISGLLMPFANPGYWVFSATIMPGLYDQAVTAMGTVLGIIATFTVFHLGVLATFLLISFLTDRYKSVLEIHYKKMKFSVAFAYLFFAGQFFIQVI